MWPNPEEFIRAMLLELEPTLTISVETTKNLEAQLPFHRITTIGGADDGFTDRTVFDVESFARTRAEAMQQAEKMRTLILSLGTREDTQSRWLIDGLQTNARPRWVDYRNANVHLYVATYVAEVRRT